MRKINVALFMSMNQVMSKYSGIMNLVKHLEEDPDFNFNFLYTNNVPESVSKFLESRPNKIKFSLDKVSSEKSMFDYVITIDPYYGPYCKGWGYNKWKTKIIYKERSSL